MIIFSLYSKGKKCEGVRESDVASKVFIFRERVCHFSLRSLLIRPLDFSGLRNKAVLRSEGFTWVPVLRSFDKLREVEVLSYLFYS